VLLVHQPRESKELSPGNTLTIDKHTTLDSGSSFGNFWIAYILFLFRLEILKKVVNRPIDRARISNGSSFGNFWIAYILFLFRLEILKKVVNGPIDRARISKK